MATTHVSKFVLRKGPRYSSTVYDVTLEYLGMTELPHDSDDTIITEDDKKDVDGNLLLYGDRDVQQMDDFIDVSLGAAGQSGSDKIYCFDARLQISSVSHWVSWSFILNSSVKYYSFTYDTQTGVKQSMELPLGR